MPYYLCAQYLGAFCAALTLYLQYYEAIQAYDKGVRVPYYSPDIYPSNPDYSSIATGGVFSTYPAPFVSVFGAIVDQTIATFSMMFGVMVLTSPKNGMPNYLHPILLALLIVGHVVAFGLNCGATLNPARDIGPRLFQLVSGYGIDAFK